MARLGVGGSSRALRAELMPHGFAGEVMQLVAETWRDFSMHRTVRLEEPITALFATALEDAYVAQGRSWFVFPEVPVTDPTFGTQTGRNDLRFFTAIFQDSGTFSPWRASDSEWPLHPDSVILTANT